MSDSPRILVCPKCNVATDDGGNRRVVRKCGRGHPLERVDGTFEKSLIVGFACGAVLNLGWYLPMPKLGSLVQSGLGLLLIGFAGGGFITLFQGLFRLFRPQPTRLLAPPQIGMGLGWSCGTAMTLYALHKNNAIFGGSSALASIVGVVLGLVVAYAFIVHPVLSGAHRAKS